MNFVRLGVMWEAVERTEGVFDDDYLDKVETLINQLGEAGIYTLVDMHQDVWARSICGEGIPNFYAREAFGKKPHCRGALQDKALAPFYKKFGLCKSVQNDYGYSKDADGNPLIKDCQQNDFAMYYTSPEALNVADALYNNIDGLQDKFIAYWDYTSKKFSNNKYVVGYDPLNEPYPGNNFKNPLLNTPGKADKELLAPMYEKIFAKYQANSVNNTMWFEPVQVPDQIPEGIPGTTGGQ